MIPIRHTASLLVKKTCTAPRPAAAYTTRSNGAAFLNNLDFLAPAPSSPRTSAPIAPSSPLGFKQTTITGNSSRPSPPTKAHHREYLKGSPSPLAAKERDDDLDTLLGSLPLSDEGKRPSSTHHRRTNTILTATKEDKRPVLNRARRDEEIDSMWIQYIGPEGNQGEKKLSSVLRTIDRSKFFLVEVDSTARPPICKLLSKKELYEKAKQAKQSKKANESATKELQLNWGTDNHDLAHKLARSRGFLEKGYRLDIQINGKKRKTTTPQEREAIMERVKAEFEPVSKYVKQPEWIKATTVTMLLQGLTKKAENERRQEQQA
ncbi:hypothetical protein BGZ98_006582 [Dissophora globulifera]|nr:hypothetical protein BGZ98_006582 [Dissophora globulifera]